MLEHIAPLLDTVHNNPHWAIFALFLVSLAESLFVVGLFIPGIPVMTGAGMLIGSGVLPLIPSLLAAIAGAVAGDSLSYWLGKTYQNRIREWSWIKRYPQLLANGEAFFQQYGGISVLLGRFIGPVRPIIPAIAGMLNMPPRVFFFYNVLSASLWAPAYMLPGALLGSSISHISLRATWHLFLLVIFAVIVGIIAYRMLRAACMGLHWPLEYHLSKWWQNILDTPRLKPLETAIAHAYFPLSHRPLGQLLLTLCATVALLGLTWGVLHSYPALLLADHTLLYFIQSWQHPSLFMWAQYGSLLGKTSVICAFYGAILCIALYRKDYWIFAHGCILFAATIGSVVLMKHGVAATRPPVFLLFSQDSVYSFPSGHVSRILMAAGFWALLLTHPLQPDWWRNLCWRGVISLTLCMGLCRLYTQAHWLSDIVAGILCASIPLSAIALSYRRRPVRFANGNPRAHDPLLYMLPLLCAIPLYSWHLLQLPTAHSLSPAVFTAQYRPLDADNWWNSEGFVPMRTTLLGKKVLSLNVQLDGNATQFVQTLKASGWQDATPLHAVSILHWLDNTVRLTDLPLFPTLHYGKMPCVVLIYPDAKEPQRMLSLRLWRSRYTLMPGNRALFLGTLQIHTRKHYLLGLLSIPDEGSNQGVPTETLHTLSTQLHTDFEVRIRQETTENELPAQILIRATTVPSSRF